MSALSSAASPVSPLGRAATPLLRDGRPCPVCGGRSDVHLQDVELPQIDGSPLPSRYGLVACTSCDLCFADTPAPQSAYDDHYRSLATYASATGTSGGQNPADRVRMAELAARVTAFHGGAAGAALRVLDLGSGAGGLLHALRDLGHVDCLGLDPDPAAVALAAARGLVVREGLVTSALEVLAGEAFDVIVLSHVLEHVRDTGWFAGLRVLLAPGGVLYAEVPDARRYAVGDRPPGYFYDSEHINHFGPRALAALGRTAGLQVLDQQVLDLPLADGTTYPAIGVALSDGGAVAFQEPGPAAVVPAVQAYLLDSERVRLDRMVLEPALEPGRPFLVWGVGSFTQRLLGDRSLLLEDVLAFVDGAESKQGRTVAGRPVIAPDDVRTMHPSIPVVVCVAVGGANAARAVAERTGSPVHRFVWGAAPGEG